MSGSATTVTGIQLQKVLGTALYDPRQLGRGARPSPEEAWVVQRCDERSRRVSRIANTVTKAAIVQTRSWHAAMPP